MSETIELPPPDLDAGVRLVTAMAERRSLRELASDELGWAVIGQLAWAAQGITDREGGLRTAPSAGALYPLELDIVVASGVFRHHVSHHRLRRRLTTDVRKRLADAAHGQHWIAAAACVFVLSAVEQRTARRYGPRATRYVHMEAGHAAQNLLLQAVALDLGATPVGAFDDEGVARVLELAAREEPLYLLPVGRFASAGR